MYPNVKIGQDHDRVSRRITASVRNALATKSEEDEQAQGDRHPVFAVLGSLDHSSWMALPSGVSATFQS